MLIKSRQDFKTEFQHFDEDSTRVQNWNSACQECLNGVSKVGLTMMRKPQPQFDTESQHAKKSLDMD
jgi:hypothetical protein